MAKPHAINELARLTNTASIELTCYIVGVIVNPDGTQTFTDQWRLEIDGEVVGRGKTPQRAIESALWKARKTPE